MILNKDKILLRAIEDKDLEELYQFRFSDESYDYFYEFPIVSLEDYKKWTQSLNNKPDQVNFVIEDKNTKKIIGTISLINIDNRSKKAEMGRVFLKPDFRGIGQFKSALEALLSYAFGDLNLRKIYCEVFSDNKNAIDAYLKNGFFKEGTLKEHIYKNYIYRDVSILSIFKK